VRWDGGPGGGWGGAGLTGSASSSVVRDAWFFGHDVVEVGERRGLGRDPRTVRLHPYLSRLVEQVGADPARLRAMAAEARERAATLVAAGANPRSRRIVGYVRGAAMLEAAAASLPPAPPPAWHRPQNAGPLRRLRVSWWRRNRAASSGRAVYHLARRARDVSAVQVVLDGAPVGMVRFQVCSRCRVAAVESVEVAAHVRGVGVGARLVAAALRTAPPRDGYQWHTVGQPEAVLGFWRAMAKRFQFEPSHVDHVPCAHMAGTAAGCDVDQAGR
jgi:GNAT superfamily N-acetyltransferase